MNVNGWIIVEADNFSLPKMKTFNSEDFPFYYYESYSDASNHDLGIIHDCFSTIGMYEQMSLNVGDKTRFLYSFNGDSDRLSMVNYLQKVFVDSKISLYALLCNDREASKTLHYLYVAMMVSKGINKRDTILVDDRYGLSVNDLNFIKNIYSKLSLDEKTMLSFTNKNTVKALRHFDDLCALTV